MARALKTRGGYWRSRALLLVATAGLLAACGGGDSEPAQSSSSTSPNTANLAWDTVMDPNLSGYRIYYGTTSGTYLQSYGKGIPVGKASTYSVTGLSAGTRYFFAATAYDTMGNESDYSNEVFKDVP